MTDFLLVLLKELLCVRSDFRVILMSATLDVRTFTGYLWNCQVIEIPTGPRYTVEEIYLEDAYFGERWAAGLPAHLLAREESARQAEEAMKEEAVDDEGDGEGEEQPFRSSANAWWGSSENDETYIDLMARVLMQLADGPPLVDDNTMPGSVLCFLPGWAEIKTIHDRLQEFDRTAQKLWVLPLHSTLPKEEQQLIFSRPPAGKMKVVLGTNIAESSVTIDDVVVVVDAGLAREVSYDPVRRLSVLETVWVSQSSAIQRMGRAGRVRQGRCYRLYSRAQLEQAPWRSSPEMQRCELSSTCLQALALRREAREFLGRAPDPPSVAAVETALEELLQLGAVCEPPGGENGGLREQMMPLGEALSRMTVSPTLGRMLLLGTLFGVTQEACLLASVIAAQRRIFACPPGRKKESLACTRGFSTTSDTLAAFGACQDYEGWREVRTEAYADRWAGELFLVPKRVKGLLQGRDSHREELQKLGFCPKYANFEENMWETTRWARSLASDDIADSREAWDDGVEGTDGGPAPSADGATVDSGNDEKPAEGDPIELVKALLVAAYPQNVALRRRINMAKHNTSTGLEAIIAPQSVNAPVRIKPSAAAAASVAASQREDEGGGSRRQPSWWSYGQLHISQKHGFLRNTTLVDPLHVALFGGLTATEDESGALREVDRWIELRSSRTTLKSLAKLREAMTRSINLRALEPGVSLPDGLRSTLREVVSLLRTATARQERISSSLHEGAPVQHVEKPPPPSERPRRARGGGRGSSGRGGGGRGSGNWGVGAWEASGGWSQSTESHQAQTMWENGTAVSGRGGGGGPRVGGPIGGSNSGGDNWMASSDGFGGVVTDEVNHANMDGNHWGATQEDWGAWSTDSWAKGGSKGRKPSGGRGLGKSGGRSSWTAQPAWDAAAWSTGGDWSSGAAWG
eukprot:TRINITY_DN26197_c0_g1_i1.p1 TRINITY_DN26197_c0_g1~~TRINITY_DN26197_c0_g1_i1.p1  ORF type:complete len:1030 (-),score=253.06 TRINITY_DN26197_c0_g1_i1:76-2829(-)